MRNSIIILVSASLLIIALSWAGMETEEETIQGALTAAEKVFNSSEKMEVNNMQGSFSMYLPNNLEVKEQDESNVILKNDDQTYIVFFNSLEGPLSRLGYESATAGSEDAIVLETFEDKDKFGYIRILPHEEADYELQIGVGGVKVTTYTSKEALKSDAEKLMKIARSIVLQNSNIAQK